MARYNSVNSISSVAGGSTISTPLSGLLTTLTGTGTINIPNPVLYAGAPQTYYNAAGVVLTLSTNNNGNFVGPGASGSSTQTLANGSIISLISDGTNYVVQSWLGGASIATSLTVNGVLTANPANASISLQPTGTGTVNIAPGTTVGTIDKMNIGATTAGTGAFTSLTANGAVTLTSAGTASAYNTVGASLLVSGGVGIAGAVYTNSTATFASTLTVSANGASITGAASTTAVSITANSAAGINISGNTSSNVLGDINVNRSGSAQAGIGQGANLQLNNTTANTSLMIQEYQGGLSIWSAISGTWSQRITMLPSGYLGIGNTSPQVPLHITAANSTNTLTTGSHIRLENSGSQTLIGFTFGGTAKAAIRVDSTGNIIFDSLGDYYFNYELGTIAFNLRNGATGIFQSVSGTTVNFPGTLQYGGNTVLSAGNYTSYVTNVSSLGTGVSYDVGSRVTKNGGIAHYGAYSGGANGPTTYDYALQVTNGSRGWEMVCDWISAPQPYLRALRDCCQPWSGWYSLSIAAVSDARRKTNIEPIINPRDILFSLNGKIYDVVNEDGTLGAVSDEDPDLRVDRPQEFGYIAQDAIKTVPQVVKFNPRFDTPNEVGWANAYTIDYERLVPVVTESVKEIYTEVDTLKELIPMITEMKEQIAALQAEIAALKGKN